MHGGYNNPTYFILFKETVLSLYPIQGVNKCCRREHGTWTTFIYMGMHQLTFVSKPLATRNLFSAD